MRKSTTLLATAALALTMTACATPQDEPTPEITTTVAPAAKEDTRPLLIRLADTGVPVYDLDTATLEDNAAIVCAARDMGVSHEEILEVSIEHMTMWQPVDSEKYLHFVYSEVCPTLTDPATSTRK